MNDKIVDDFQNYFFSKDFFDYSEHSQNQINTSIQANASLGNEVRQESEMKVSDYLVAFSTKTENYCVGLVDMVNSTKISAQISPSRVSRYYQIFLNSMSKILSRFGGFVIKNIGDCLVYYFPESNKTSSKYGFLSCLECSLAMLESQNIICEQLRKEKLPHLDYRVSVDFGSIVIMKSNTSDSLDMIGPPVNMCAKINHHAKPNQAVIGGDLYQMVKGFDEYAFKELSGYSLGLKFPYPVYLLERR